jgi:hypothetical protein
MKLRIAACVVFGLLACAAASKADVIIAADVGTAGSPVQPGFLPWNLGGIGGSITNPSNGVSITMPSADAFQGNRDRGAGGVLTGSPIAALLQDFAHSSGAAGNVPSMTLVVAGLLPNTDYKVTLFGFDRTDNDGRGTSWYFGTNSSGPLIVSLFNNNSPPLTLGPVFSQLFNTGGGTTLSFFGLGDFSVQGPPLGPPNTASVVLFNGLIVETVIPEPTSLALWSLVSLVGMGAAWRRRKKAKANCSANARSSGVSSLAA